ncbi:hypothetical protein N7457_004369 [Penicillium paradoxum]|uniref:uncharacterized protein n=1 Tax=Penicillium paradoxum TaxID=176176 RepID=UPI00254972DC|nr:uncharacterized protein N7457_004369 [Penicillium paradoxum]KAJ5782595.1 hypothetical protein N7457_004369 [Penicillium paradoxum]
MPSDSKTKIRPQQSCLRCRERKVKCDRSIPCHACIIRGLEAECTYSTTPEDRAHISQSEIINQLRREVAQLRGRLDQPPRELSCNKRASSDQASGKSKNRRQHAPVGYSYGNHTHGHGSGYVINAGAGSAGGTPDAGEGSWRGSSPSSSTTMTNSAIVTSPDSTGSENGARPSSISSLSASASVSTSASAYPIATGYAPRIADLDGSAVIDPFAFGNDSRMSNCYTGDMSFAPGDMAGTVPVQMHGFPAHRRYAQDAIIGVQHPPLYGADHGEYLLGGRKASPYLQNTHYHTPVPTSTITHDGEKFPISNEYDSRRAYHPWGMDTYGNPNSSPNQLPHMHPYQAQAHYSTINSSNTDIATANTNINVNIDAHLSLPTPTPVASDTSSHPSPSSQDRPSPRTIMNSMSRSWKVEGKQEMLEILLETIGSCDEKHLPQVIHVLRMSASPEEAVSGVCRVLGIGNGR